MPIAIFLKLLHVLSAMWFVGGVLGRGLALSHASKATDVQTTAAFMRLVDRFEKFMVIPGSFAVLLVGLVTAWAIGWPVLGFLEGSKTNWLLAAILLYLTNIPLILWIYNPRGKIFGRALQDALAQGKVTSELRDAFADKIVTAAHRYELMSILAIIALMVLKPF